jgi:acyl-CoA-binding protein
VLFLFCLSIFFHSFVDIYKPQNRDRLELYALHKQAVSGDAPSSLATQTAAERAKYTSWRTKSGLSQQEAMRLYLAESERQVRVYGGSGTTPQQAVVATTGGGGGATTPGSQQQTPLNTPAQQLQDGGGASQAAQQAARQPRGLAAIPLLCAAASESRQAYLRRMANTRLEQAWWSRQEPLTAVPGSIWALPEALLIGTAALVERISLSLADINQNISNNNNNNNGNIVGGILPAQVLQSFLWPVHNLLLALWMEYILVSTAWNAAVELMQTIVWGSRRTGLSLECIWKDQVSWSAQTVSTLTEGHQPVTARLIGLQVWPFGFLVGLSQAGSPYVSILWQSLLYTSLLCMTWWYWLCVVPWMGGCLLAGAVISGCCFALIEMAGV